jgi:uncharacterized protein YciI
MGRAHWSFMDGYAERMIARGPTTDAAGEIHTGSMHMVDLPNAEAANLFAFEYPYYLAGVYGEVLKRRWHHVLGRTMWDFAGAEGRRRFLIIGHGADAIDAVHDELVARRRRYLWDAGYLDRFIERGPLLSDDGERWMGDAMLVEVPDRTSVDEMLAQDPYSLEGLYAHVETHPWQFGGRLSAVSASGSAAVPARELSGTSTGDPNRRSSRLGNVRADRADPVPTPRGQRSTTDATG